MKNDDIDLLLESFFAEELETVSSSYNKEQERYGCCPPLWRFAEAARSDVWTPDQKQHVRNCPYCQKTLAMQWRLGCPSDSLLKAYIDGEPSFQAAFGIHLEDDNCVRCNQRLEDGQHTPSEDAALRSTTLQPSLNGRALPTTIDLRSPALLTSSMARLSRTLSTIPPAWTCYPIRALSLAAALLIGGLIPLVILLRPHLGKRPEIVAHTQQLRREPKQPIPIPSNSPPDGSQRLESPRDTKVLRRTGIKSADHQGSNSANLQLNNVKSPAKAPNGGIVTKASDNRPPQHDSQDQGVEVATVREREPREIQDDTSRGLRYEAANHGSNTVNPQPENVAPPQPQPPKVASPVLTPDVGPPAKDSAPRSSQQDPQEGTLDVLATQEGGARELFYSSINRRQIYSPSFRRRTPSSVKSVVELGLLYRLSRRAENGRFYFVDPESTTFHSGDIIKLHIDVNDERGYLYVFSARFVGIARLSDGSQVVSDTGSSSLLTPIFTAKAALRSYSYIIPLSGPLDGSRDVIPLVIVFSRGPRPELDQALMANLSGPVIVRMSVLDNIRKSTVSDVVAEKVNVKGLGFQLVGSNGALSFYNEKRDEPVNGAWYYAVNKKGGPVLAEITVKRE